MKLTDLTMSFIPTNDPRSIDPREPPAFFTWKASIDGKRWGKATRLEGAPVDLTIAEFRRLALQALEEVEATMIREGQ